ncbi:MAG TPA: GAF domain-containing protein, partial [Pseudolabrys sp.]|nr:GAF domain-containing protein [Pseudolabrys sp.]
IAIENARLLNELRQRTDDLTESLEQQTATSEVLSVISSSPADIQPVLDIIGERAEKLCEADISAVAIVEGELIRLASIHGMTEAGMGAARSFFPMRLSDETVLARAIRTRSACHVTDVLSDPQYQRKDRARAGGWRGALGVPMVRDEQVVGAIFVARKQPGLFSDAQVQLLKTFADQAVIAIENVRLFNETKNSLEQQTATADVLKIISRSAFNLQTVLDTLTESAAQLSNADMAGITRPMEGGFYYATNYNFPADWLEFVKNTPLKAGRGSIVGRALLEGKITQVDDVLADPDYTFREVQKKGGYRTFLGVPLLREGQPIGVLALGRKRIDPFTDKQIELLATFADQAVIAIENVRLFDEVQARTRELQEALDYQTATSDVLEVISRTPIDLQPVLTAICETVAKLCQTKDAEIFIRDGDRLRLGWVQGSMGTEAETWPITPGLVMGRAILNRELIQVHDLRAVREEYPEGYQSSLLVGHRTIIAVPLIQKGEAVGVLTLRRFEVKPFTDKQITLLRTFADQAVIAIENARLLTELREALEQQTATSDVLRVISSSPGELEPVFQTMLENASRICEAKFGFLWLADRDPCCRVS